MKDWAGSVDPNDRDDLKRQRREAAETPADRVKRVLIEELGGRSDLVMGVAYIPRTQKPVYELSTSRKHPTISPENIPLVSQLTRAGLTQGKDFEIHQEGQDLSPNIFTVVVGKDALERVVGETVDRDTVTRRLGIGREQLAGVKKIPAGMNGVYTINTATKMPGMKPEESTLAIQLQARGMRLGHHFKAEADGERGVVITVRQAALEDKFPATRMPSREQGAG